jgi:hypothetical protein
MFSWSLASLLTFCYLDGKEVKATANKVKSIVQQMADDAGDVKCSYSLLSSLAVEYLTRPQGINYEKHLEDGNLHLIHPQITT